MGVVSGGGRQRGGEVGSGGDGEGGSREAPRLVAVRSVATAAFFRGRFGGDGREGGWRQKVETAAARDGGDGRLAVVARRSSTREGGMAAITFTSQSTFTLQIQSGAAGPASSRVAR